MLKTNHSSVTGEGGSKRKITQLDQKIRQHSGSRSGSKELGGGRELGKKKKTTTVARQWNDGGGLHIRRLARAFPPPPPPPTPFLLPRRSVWFPLRFVLLAVTTRLSLVHFYVSASPFVCFIQLSDCRRRSLFHLFCRTESVGCGGPAPGAVLVHAVTGTRSAAAQSRAHTHGRRTTRAPR